MPAAVQLFITCLMDTFYPAAGEAVVNVLRRVGAEVDFPAAQTCCGQPAFNAGLRRQAREVARHTIQVLESAPGDVVVPSGSCTHMIRQGYPELFSGETDWQGRAETLAARTFEFSEYLVDRLGVVDIGASWDGRLTYHPSCHLSRALGIDRQPRALLAAVRGAQVVDLPGAHECCGFGGVFSVEHPELSLEFLRRKLAGLDAAAAPTLVVADSGCRMHISGGLHRQGKPQRVMYIAEVLDHVRD